MEKPEVILNLWYVYDDFGAIYYLLARTYVGTGSEEDKLALLHQYAECDHLVARQFPIPDRFHTIVHEGNRLRKIPVIHSRTLQGVGGPEILFEDAISELEKELPRMTGLSIRKDPLYCLTPVLLEVNGNFVPQTKAQVKVIDDVTPRAPKAL